MNNSNDLLVVSKRQNVWALGLCAAGVALNMLLGMIVSALGLPLYLDTVGSVVAAIIGGYLPGVAVGFATNIIKSISDPSSLYYGVLNVLIAFCATWIARHGWLKKPLGGVLMVIIFVLIGGGLGTLIPWFMDGLTFDSESLSGVIYDLTSIIPIFYSLYILTIVFILCRASFDALSLDIFVPFYLFFPFVGLFSQKGRTSSLKRSIPFWRYFDTSGI